ncbi:translocon-associated protein subunit gamma-like [Histomonas meleagridis]|uniref:translocon-associated protein subunit gamma-like n=1 Tax=Histomonas meleagridis TaxID=135588 RepID=UPI0035597E41|nr:translocon-associated protein subunit gamma-like [Histomonas meleagridis]KAH0806885.1 translocon-associated protein subunit gamma-like [Histomonas meleagridis]
MKRKSSPRQVQSEEDQESLYSDLRVSRKTGFSVHIKYLPFALITSLIGIILYITVGGIDLKVHIPYVVVAYACGVFGLTVAYSFIAQWVIKQRNLQKKNAKKQAKGEVRESEGLWFTLFYNNAFYCFLLLINSHILFSTFHPTTSMILSQLCSALIPAWLSSMSK